MYRKESDAAPSKRQYEAPEIVNVGPVTEVTKGMGGTSKDTGGYTIPVIPSDDDGPGGGSTSIFGR